MSKVYQTFEKRNYVYVVNIELERSLYEIYFMLQRAEVSKKFDLRLTVESAYLSEDANPLRKRSREIRFPILAYKVFTRQPIRFDSR